MSTARYAALLGVILTIGLTGVATANDGDPLILGRTNTAASPTGVMGQFGASSLNAGALFTDQFHPYALLIDFDPGQQTRSFLNPTDLKFGDSVLCTPQSSEPGVGVEWARESADGTKLIVHLTKAPTGDNVKVECMTLFNLGTRP
jgi:hypothetical protein